MVGREVTHRGARASARGEVGEPVLEVDDLWAAGDRGGDALRGVVADACARARSSRSPASPETASASSPRR